MKKHKTHSAYVESLERHSNPVNFALHIVAAPFFVLGLLMHRVDLLLMGLFYMFAGSLYALYGPKAAQQVWLTMYQNHVNKWFSFLGGIILLFGLWNYNAVVILIGLITLLFGLLYAALTQKY